MLPFFAVAVVIATWPLNLGDGCPVLGAPLRCRTAKAKSTAQASSSKINPDTRCFVRSGGEESADAFISRWLSLDRRNALDHRLGQLLLLVDMGVARF